MALLMRHHTTKNYVTNAQQEFIIGIFSGHFLTPQKTESYNHQVFEIVRHRNT